MRGLRGGPGGGGPVLRGRTVQAFGFRRGVLHVEGKCTSRGARLIEVNARMGGTRIHQMVEAVWGVDRPDSTFATVLAELTLSGKNLRRARSLAARVLREPPRIFPT